MDIEDLYEIYLRNSTICTDTRSITDGCLFFALKGERFNGNSFSSQALNDGALLAIVDEKEYAISENHYLVDDVLTTLQELARHHRSKLNIPIIGITGSNGKTTTKELTHAVLSQEFNCYATRGNLNNHIGVPLSVLEINNSHEIAIIEMGANHVGEIGFLCTISNPTIGLITNIGKAHLEGFGGIEGVIKAKSELYEHLRNYDFPVFVNGDNKLLMNLSEGMIKITYGQSESNQVIGNSDEGDKLTINWKKQNFISCHPTIHSNIVGEYNLENALAAICVGDHFGVSVENTKNAIESYLPKNNRSQSLDTENNKLILDAYNANPVSMNAALDNLFKYPETNKIAILGDMKELGEYSLEEHQIIVDRLNEVKLPAYLVGPEFAKTNHAGINHFESIDDLRKEITKSQIKGAIILVKGSRSVGLEKIVDVL